MIFIGDIHSRFSYYLDLIKNITHTPTVQVGDFGLGFVGYDYPRKIEGNHYFIRGNHDSPVVARSHPNYLGEYGYNEELDLFYVSGADSIDKHLRMESIDWWRDEELDYQTLNTKVLPLFEATRPRVIVTHTCPSSIKHKILGRERIEDEWGGGPSVTERALQAMFEIHQPDIWVFGHYHRFVDIRKNGTRFICLGINQAIEINGNDVIGSIPTAMNVFITNDGHTYLA